MVKNTSHNLHCSITSSLTVSERIKDSASLNYSFLIGQMALPQYMMLVLPYQFEPDSSSFGSACKSGFALTVQRT